MKEETKYDLGIAIVILFLLAVGWLAGYEYRAKACMTDQEIADYMQNKPMDGD